MLDKYAHTMEFTWPAEAADWWDSTLIGKQPLYYLIKFTWSSVDLRDSTFMGTAAALLAAALLPALSATGRYNTVPALEVDDRSSRVAALGLGGLTAAL